MRCEYHIEYTPPQPDPLLSGQLITKYTQCARKAAGLSYYGRLVCLSCAAEHNVLFDVVFDEDMADPLTFATFSEINRQRCESPAPNGFGESLAPGSKYDAEYFSMAAGEEMGEVIGAVLGAEGKKVRKKHLTKDDVLDEIGDVVACLDLLAQKYGSTVGECARNKFNKVSDRLGSSIKL